MAKYRNKCVVEIFVLLFSLIIRVSMVEICNCDQENAIAICSRLQLTDADLNSVFCGKRFWKIDLSENNLETFPNCLTQFKSVNMSRNYLETLDAINAQNVENLDVAANMLIKIDFGNMFLSLRHLNISWNKLGISNEFLFGQCNVEVLDISHNKITSLQSATRCVNLRVLLGVRNIITYIPENLSILTQLEVLDLSLNKLRNVSGFPTSLRKLNLANNGLTKISETSFKGLSSLRMLQLSENNISAIHADTFTGLLSLENLLLDENKLKTLTTESFYGLESLKNINLISNDIESVSDNTFSDLSALIKLHLDKNKLMTLPAFRLGRNVTEVSLSFNFIRLLNTTALQAMLSGNAEERQILIPFNLIRGDDPVLHKLMGIFNWECIYKLPIHLIRNLKSRYRNHKLANSECPCVKLMKGDWTLAVCISDAGEINGVPWYKIEDIPSATGSASEQTDYYFQNIREEL